MKQNMTYQEAFTAPPVTRWERLRDFLWAIPALLLCCVLWPWGEAEGEE